jgi:DNA-binding PadR family transcriptional regulator
MALRDDAALLILTSLAGGAKHGYAMIDDIKSITGARIGPGTLYGAIARLETEGMILALETDDRRRPYEITAAGRRRLEAEIGGMGNLVAAGRRRLRRA